MRATKWGNRVSKRNAAERQPRERKEARRILETMRRAAARRER